MSVYDLPKARVRVELGDPVPFAGATRRELLLAAALGAPLGTSDPVDLALLGAASHREDLRHYRQLSYTPLDPVWPRSIARVRRADTGEEWLLARGELEAVLELCHPDQATRYRAELQAEMKMQHGFRPLGVARGTREAAGERWSFLGYLPLRATGRKRRHNEEPEEFRYVQVWDWQLRSLHWLALFLLIMVLFLAFIPIHVYLSIRADTVERERAISSIVSGGRWCRKDTQFEDGSV